MNATHPTILIQLDSDPHASVFDSVVAIDSGVCHLLRHQAVEPLDVRGLVHGAMFTRGPNDLKNTAVFIGGSDVATGEKLLEQVKACFFGPIRVSVMLDANGANTTAAAAVIAASRHVGLAGATAAVLAGTGPVGQRAVRLLARCGATVRVGSRSREKAAVACQAVRQHLPEANLLPYATATAQDMQAVLDGAELVITAGAAGVELVSAAALGKAKSLKVAIDLNAVPPAGIAGIEVMDKARDRGGVICYGAIGVGGTKMKIHQAAIRQLFASNDQVLDAEEIFALGQGLEKK